MDEILRQIVYGLLELVEECKKSRPGLYREGQLGALAGVLEIVQHELSPLGPENYGLDCEIEDLLV